MFRRYLGSRLIIGLLVACVVFFSCTVIGAEEALSTPSRLFDEMGLIVGYGSQNIAEGSYEPILLIARFGHNMKDVFPGLAETRGRLSVYFEPQMNPVIGPKANFEFGLGIGLKYQYPLNDRIAVFLMGSIGPHYVSVVSKDQANGFIFSDTMGAGFSWFLTEKSAVSAEYRFRHLSNASLMEPNGGIDTHLGAVGYSYFF